MKPKYTKLQIALEIIGFLLLIGLVAFVYIQWDKLPQQIPVHYNAFGEIDRWGSKTTILMPVVICIAIYVFISVMSFFPNIWNVPVRITEENKEKVYQYTLNLVILMKIELVIIFFTITYYTANTQTLPVILLPILILILFGTIIFYVMKTSRLGKRVI